MLHLCGSLNLRNSLVTIILKKNICNIIDESDVAFLRKLDNYLSFKVQGAEHTWAFKNGSWNGIRHILTSNLTFPAGLLKRVEKFYQKHKKELKIIDNRIKASASTPIDIDESLSLLGKIPYDYQVDVLNAAKENNCGIIRSATGSGKTIMSAMMIAHFGKRAIIYVIGKDLLWQTYEFFDKVFDQEIGIVGDGECKIELINVVSVWTVGQALGVEKSKILLDTNDGEKAINKEKYKDILDLMRTAKVHIFDECHLASCDTIQSISTKINSEHLYGLSASPYRDDGSDLLIEGVFGSTIIDIPASQLIKSGLLAKPLIKFVKVPPIKNLPKTYSAVYKEYITENEIRNNLIIKNAINLVNKGYKTLILFSKLSHGKILFNKISKKIPVILLSGKDSLKKRQEAKDKIASGEIKCILASTIFDIGVDLPALSGLVIAGGGKSSIRAVQRVGRVIRRYEKDGYTKTHAAIVDFYDQAKFLKKHTIVRYKIYSSEEEFSVYWPK